MVNRNLRDGLNLASKLTPRRISNILKVFSSYSVSRITKRPVQWGKPISISVEPTTSCNLRCPQCPSGLRAFTRPTGMLEIETFKKIVDELGDELLYLTLYFQGEPYLNKHFIDFVSYASSKKIYTSTSTNAHYLSSEMARRTIESGLDRLIISIDGIDQQTYEQYRVGGKLDKVIEGTKNLIYWRNKLNGRKPHIIWQFIVFSHNQHQIEPFLKLAEEIGVDETGIKTAQVYDYENNSSLIPDDPRYSRYEKGSDNNVKIKNKLLNHCWRLWQGCVFTWNGAIVPCCFDKDADNQLGNILQHGFQSVWQGAEYQQFRRSILKSRSNIEICKNCTEGTKIWG